MTAISSSPTRRSLLAGSAATGAVSLLPIHFVAARAQSKQGGSPLGMTKADAILPFRVNVRGEDLANLRRRLGATRWPTKELVEDRSQRMRRDGPCRRAAKQRDEPAPSKIELHPLLLPARVAA